MGPFCGTDPHTDSDGVKNTTVKAKAKDLAAKDEDQGQRVYKMDGYSNCYKQNKTWCKTA